MLDPLWTALHAVNEGRLAFRGRDRSGRAALEAHQERLAAGHLRWVAAHSPWTAERFRAAGLPLARWRELPPTGKSEMMANFDRLNTAGLTLAEVLACARHAEDSRDFRPTLRGTPGTPYGGQPLTVGLSSGTTGNQGAFLVSPAERQQWAGVVLRHLLPPPFWSSAIRPQRVAFVLRAEGGLYRSVQSRRLQFTFLDLLRPLPELAAALTRADPTLLVGPPSVLRALLEAGAVARPRRVIAVAEVLEDDDRAALERGYAAPVVGVYQATEGLLALPCEAGELHLNEAHVHFDWEDLGHGRVRPILTDLRRRLQPIIRHRLDDVLHLHDQPCPCGRAARRVARIEGRQDDALRLPSPSGAEVTVWPDFVRAALNRVPGLRDYRAEQTAPRSLTLYLDPCTPATVQAAQTELRLMLARLGVDAGQVKLSGLPLSPLPPGTKRRRVLSRPSVLLPDEVNP